MSLGNALGHETKGRVTEKEFEASTSCQARYAWSSACPRYPDPSLPREFQRHTKTAGTKERIILPAHSGLIRVGDAGFEPATSAV
jgi:hypothetical protein